MITEMLAQAPRPVEAVNKKPAATIIAEGLDRSWMSQVTAGASAAVAVPPGAWNWSLPEGRTVELDYEPGLFNVSITGVADEPWPVGEIPKAEETKIYDPAAGSGGLLLALAEWLSKSFEAVNVSSVLATHPSEDHIQGLLHVNVGPLTTYRSVLNQVKQGRDSILHDVRRRLDRARASYAQRAPREVATELGDERGVGQLAIARALGVTPTAVRKWRRGEPARAEHRDQLAKLAALMSLLSEVGLHDPASWIDIPVSTDSTLKPLDLFVSGRSDLVVLLAAGLIDPQDALDEFAPAWREAFAPDPDYEVVRLSDGSRSVVARKGGRT